MLPEEGVEEMEAEEQGEAGSRFAPRRSRYRARR
jgi:hypothetical protein